MKHTNRLLQETSPYLLQHAHNPVDWYPWGDAAFEKAKSENKPVLVSIGYSTCHWCHVMERESFENEEVAAFMNEHFVNIKVDREERPDVDSIYMEAVQMISGGHGGWPLNCFLLPDRRPFYGGTYFPPSQAHGRSSWMMVLNNIRNAFANRPEEVKAQADKLMNYISDADNYFLSSIETKEQTIEADTIHNCFLALSNNFDESSGGFGHAPKFPSTMSLRFCLNHYHFGKNEEAMQQLQLSLDAMIYGGIYDQLGGGFSRYTVDKDWLVPHFEKMLYDNALLVGLLSDTYKITKKTLYKETVEESFDWLSREMTNTEGGFYSALDADSEGVEGKFYVWSKSEIDMILKADSPLFCEFYDVTEVGNWEHRNILNRPQSFAGFTAKKGLSEDAFKALMKNCRDKLMTERDKRIRPGLDDKILLAWNALMCTASCKAYEAFGEAKYKAVALSNIEFICDKFIMNDATVLHDYKNGKAKTGGFLDDYAYLIEALIAVYEICFDKKYLKTALKLSEVVMDEFYDPADSLFFYSSKKQQDLIIRKKDLYDNAMPSGNSTMSGNLRTLGLLFNRADFLDISYKSLLTMKKSIQKYPQSFALWANQFFPLCYPVKEIAISGKRHLEYAQQLKQYYLPFSVFAAADSADNEIALLEDRNPKEEITEIFICSNYSCQLPCNNTSDALKLLN